MCFYYFFDYLFILLFCSPQLELSSSYSLIRLIIITIFFFFTLLTTFNIFNTFSTDQKFIRKGKKSKKKKLENQRRKEENCIIKIDSNVIRSSLNIQEYKDIEVSLNNNDISDIYIYICMYRVICLSSRIFFLILFLFT